MSRETCNNVATNLQRAIEYFEHLILQLGDSTHDGPILSEHKKQSTKMAETALSALREQQAREKGCDYCGLIYKLDGASYGTDSVIIENRYCPMCGRRLKEDNHET